MKINIKYISTSTHPTTRWHLMDYLMQIKVFLAPLPLGFSCICFVLTIYCCHDYRWPTQFICTMLSSLTRHSFIQEYAHNPLSILLTMLYRPVLMWRHFTDLFWWHFTGLFWWYFTQPCLAHELFMKIHTVNLIGRRYWQISILLCRVCFVTLNRQSIDIL